MDRRWVGTGGYEVVPARRAGRQVLRVRRHGRLVADCVSVADVARHVDLADLCEIITLPGTSSHHGWAPCMVTPVRDDGQAPIAQSAERLHGKEKVNGSIPFGGSS